MALLGLSCVAPDKGGQLKPPESLSFVPREAREKHCWFPSLCLALQWIWWQFLRPQIPKAAGFFTGHSQGRDELLVSDTYTYTLGCEMSLPNSFHTEAAMHSPDLNNIS